MKKKLLYLLPALGLLSLLAACDDDYHYGGHGAHVRDNRQEWRQDNRDDRQEWRQDNRDDRQEWRQGTREHRQDRRQEYYR